MRQTRSRGATRKATPSRKRKALTSRRSKDAAELPSGNQAPGPSVGSILSTAQAKYRIERPLGEGGRGRTFVAVVIAREANASSEIPAVGTSVVIKTGKIDEKWGRDSTLYFIDFVDKRLLEEQRALSKLKDLKCVAQVADSGTYRVTLFGNEIAEPRFLVQQHVKGTVLAKAFVDKGSEEFAGIKNAKAWFDLAIDIAEALIAVHQKGIVHNDIWHWNIMLDESRRVVLIDFGEAIFRTAHRLAYIDKPERRDPWIDPEWEWTHIRPSRRADIFAVGGVLFWLACGQDPPMPSPDKDQSKYEIEEKIKAHNPLILEQSPLIADVIARCRRYERKERIPNAENLRRELLAYGRPTTVTNPTRTARRIAGKVRSLFMGKKQPFLARWADSSLRQLERQMEDMVSGVIEINGSHEELASGIVDALGCLKPGDEFLAVSTLKFWRPENIGVRGRFYSMTDLCARRGVKIRRVFLLTEADQRNEHFWPIMTAQIELTAGNDALGNGCLQTRFLLLPPREFVERVDRGDHCGYWISGGQVMDAFPVYDVHDALRSVRLIVSDVASEIALRNFNKVFDLAEPLTLSALTGHMRSDPHEFSARSGS
jgi:serine/threonine protein kinase